MSMPGFSEWLVILVIVLIFFGVGKLPDVLGQMGKGVRAFKDGMSTDKDRPKQIEADDAEELRSSSTTTTSSGSSSGGR